MGSNYLNQCTARKSAKRKKPSNFWTECTEQNRLNDKK